MAMSKKPFDTSPLQSTRQMLDEMDALMERMLSLPVKENEEAELPPLPRDVLKPPPLAASITFLNEDKPFTRQENKEKVEEEDENIFAQGLVNHKSAQQVSAPIVTPSKKPEKPRPYKTREEQIPHYDELEAELPPLVINRPVQIISSPATSRLALGQLCLKPLIWTNQTFDRCTAWLEPLNPVLRSKQGRFMLGILGVFFLAIACAWVIQDYRSWTR